jgi:malonate transporter and related proteins
MLHIFWIVLPVFGLIGLGFVARMVRLVGDRTGEGLSDYVFAIAIPCLIFKTLTGTALPESQPWGYWLSYFAAVALVWALSQGIASRFFALDHGSSVVAGFTGAQANTVLVGVPLILQAYGKEGAVPLFLLVAVHLPIMFTVATVLIEGRDAHWPTVIRQLLTHPILLAILFSSAFHFAGLEVPAFAGQLIDPIAASALPCALFAMGIALKRYGVRGNLNLAAILCAFKLLLHPALVYVLAFYVFPVPPVWAGVAVLFASSPSGINAYLFAERYKTGIALASGGIALSTALSVLSSSLWLAVLGIR